MKWCRFCGEGREDIDLRRTRSKETMLIMLCAMLEKGKVNIKKAQDMYIECLSSQKRMCKSHFHEAALYIGDVVDTMSTTTVRNLFTMPGYMLGKIVARFESQRLAIGANTELTAYKLATFHREFSEVGGGVPAGSRKRMCTLHCALGNLDRQLEEKCENPMSTDPTSIGDTEKQVCIPPDPTMDPENIPELDETDPKLLDEDFLIKGSQLLKLFRFCPSCGSKISDSVRCLSLTAVGTAPIVHYICTACSPFEKRFEGQEEANSYPEEIPETTEQNVDAITMDTVCVNTQRWTEPATDDSSPSLPLKQPRLEEEMIDTSPRQKVEVRASESVPDDHNCDVGPTSTLQQPAPEHENGSSESSNMSCDDVTSGLSAEPGIKDEWTGTILQQDEERIQFCNLSVA